MTQPEPFWSIILARQAETTLRRLPPASFRLLDRQILALAENPRPPQCQRLVGYEDLYRLRVSEWRIAYAVEDERRLVLILEIVPKQQLERYPLDFEEAEVKGEGGTPEPEFLTPLNPNLAEEQRLQSLEKQFSLEALRHLIPEMQPGAMADLIRSLELLKRFAAAQLEADSQAQPGHAAWYMLYCPSGSERRIKQGLIHHIQLLGLQDQVLRVVALDEIAADTPREEEKQTALPGPSGAILVEMILDDDTWRIVRDTPGITAYHGSDDRPIPLQPDQVGAFFRGTVDIPRILPLVEATGREKIRLCIRVASLPLQQDLYKMILPEPGLELAGDPAEADIIFTETVVPKGVFSSPSPVEQVDIEPFEISSELWLHAGQTLILVQDLASYLTTPTAPRNFLKAPFSREELIQTVHRVYHLSLEQDTMNSALKSLKTLKLGHWAELSLSVANLSTSLFFYEKLGLKPVDGGEQPYPWTVVSDGTLQLGLHQQPFVSPTLSYFSWGETISKRVAILKKLNITFDRITTRDIAYGLPAPDLVSTAEFTGFEGQHLCLANFWRDLKQPQRNFSLSRNQFGELSLKTADVRAATTYWEQFGFKRIASSDNPYPWATLSDGLIRLGLHQTTRFTRPTISYFSPDMPDRLQHLLEQDIPFLSEYKDAQGRTIGAVIRSPDGQPFFLFTGQLG